MAIITDEQMRDVSDILGQAYNRYKDAIGDTDTPNSLIFETDKLTDYLNAALPKEGIVSGCLVSIPSDTTTIRVALGVVRGNDTSINFPQTDVTINRAFQSTFSNIHQYGVVVAFKRSDVAESSAAFRTTISASLTADTSTSISLTDSDLLSEFSPPFKITVGTEEIEISAISGSTATVAPHYNSGTGTVTTSHTSGDTAFVSKPLIPEVIFGAPVAPSFQTNDDPTTFSYYPPVSQKDYILIGRGIVSNPNTTDVARVPQLVAIEDLRELVDTPAADTFTATDIRSIEGALDAMRQIANSQGTSGSPSLILSALVDWSEREAGETFTSYWNDRNFVSRSNFLRGESLSGLTRFEFSDEFKELYYDQFGIDLMTTFSMFRGDIFGGSQVYGDVPTGLTGAYAADSSANLTSGTWVYRVTAITASGESAPTTAVSVSIPASSGDSNRVTLTWTKVAAATYYHVYRMSNFADRFVEFRLTAASEVVHGSGATVSYIDTGADGNTTIRRGVKLTGKTTNVASQLQVYVPPILSNLNPFLAGDDLDPSFTSETATQNDMEITIQGLDASGAAGTSSHTVSIPQGTTRGAKFDVGAATDLYTGVYDMTVVPGDDLNLQNGEISWSTYDFFVVQNV